MKLHITGQICSSSGSCDVFVCVWETPRYASRANAGVKDRSLWIQEFEAARISRESAHEGGKVVSPMRRPHLPPR